jgi:hypothetical protein
VFFYLVPQRYGTQEKRISFAKERPFVQTATSVNVGSFVESAALCLNGWSGKRPFPRPAVHAKSGEI